MMLSSFFTLAPQIYKSEFDNEANNFLLKYYPEALEIPLAVPIIKIAREKMGLQIIERHLSEDFSILGQMVFTNGVEDIYDKEKEEFRAFKIRYGTMIIDPDTILKRNEGCKNNTVAHECYHWHKHRDYHISISVQKSSKSIKQVCRFDEKPETTYSSWTDEEWMEWQANGVAPRILMPLNPFKTMVEQLMTEYDEDAFAGTKWYSLHNWAVNNLARFFKVSKKSVEIRLSETGYCLH
jgi:Zn-dependent peptidase ImmA (M78 family)